MLLTDTVFHWLSETLTRLDILPWLLGTPLIAFGCWFLFAQRKAHKALKKELDVLSQVKRNSIEYELVLKTMHLCVWRMDLATRSVTYENDYREYYGSVMVEQGGDFSSLLSHMPEPHAAAVSDGISDLAADRIENFHEQYQVSNPQTGQTYWAESFAIVDKRDAAGKPLTIVGASMRIDHQKEIEDALMEALYHAEESDRLKSAFLANISHEVRTPLNAIIGFSDVLPMATSEEERNSLISLIKKNNAKLLRLFDDTVRMSKLEARGGEAIRKRKFDLHAMLSGIAAKYKAESEETGVVLTVDDNTHMTLNADEDRLSEVVNQYVNNAFKFTAKGVITLGQTLTGSTVRIWVRDTGKGIPEDKCNIHLFDRFVKLDDFGEGSGLGLSICRSIALSMNGKVGVESTVGQGSTFWIEINLED